MCLLGFGSYFCFDNPGALQTDLKKEMNLTNAEFANLYSFYSWPNVVLPAVGGFLIDKYLGIPGGAILFSFIICIGQIIVAVGGFTNNLSVMYLGRFVFGLGGESLAVAQNMYAVSWFKGKELNMVFGLQLSAARLGSTMNFLVMDTVLEWLGGGLVGPTALGSSLLLAGSLCIVSCLCSLLLALMDKRRSTVLGITTSGNTTKEVRIRDIKSFPKSFWFVTLACVAYYGALFPFVSLAQGFFMTKFGYTSQQANSITGLIYLLSCPAAPLFGKVIDCTGRNITWVFLGVLASIGCFSLLNFSEANPYIGICSLGVACSLLASALWPIVALLVPDHQLGTAYGLMQAIQNLGIAFINMGAGYIVDSYGYFWQMNFFLFWLVFCLACTVCIWLTDYISTGYVNMDIASRNAYEIKRAESEDEERRMQLSGSISRNRYLGRLGLGPWAISICKGLS